MRLFNSLLGIFRTPKPNVEGRMIPPGLAAFIVARLVTTKAILLRGRESILCGEPQNDIDIYTTQPVDEVVSSLSCFFNLRSLARTGQNQWRAIFEESDKGTFIPIDIFHEIAWRGIPIINMRSVQIGFCDRLHCFFLDDKDSMWLTVLKNTLHGSPTPNNKIENVTEDWVGPILTGGSSPALIGLEKWIGRKVWAIGRAHRPRYMDVFLVRVAFVTLRLLEQPLGTLFGFFLWTRNKIRNA